MTNKILKALMSIVLAICFLFVLTLFCDYFLAKHMTQWKPEKKCLDSVNYLDFHYELGTYGDELRDLCYE